MGRLTTHVLDTARGIPAAGMEIELWRLDDTEQRRVPVRIVRTNAEGRTDAPLLDGAHLTVGIYELVFAVGAYFNRHGMVRGEPFFLDHVPIRFGVADPNAHYHVPLLVSPWAYSTYRGS
jgi:5-hydroxyisourate hydrolase